MRVLFASIPQPANRFVADLKAGIEKHAEVVWDFEEFWACKNHYDVIHIHESEYLSYEIESYIYNDKPIEEGLWKRLIECLEYWKKNSVIINTRHVQEPHIRADEEMHKWYRTVLSYCSGIAHFANYSILQFKEFYPDFTGVEHKIIPHQNYISLGNNSDKKAAKEYLRIKEKDTVMLVFGNIKEHEKEFVKQAFDFIPGSNKVLLTPGWKVQRRKISYIRLREWVFRFEKWLSTKKYRHRYNLGFIKEDDAHYYANASDFLFIPRTNELNSGNITFGFTFGLVVVGKDSADIGEILLETKNPVFEVGNKDSLSKAIKSAVRIAKEGRGKLNQDLAIREYGISQISASYFDLYQNVIKKKDKPNYD